MSPSQPSTMSTFHRSEDVTDTQLTKIGSFKIHYFPLHCTAATARDMMAFAGVEWTDVFPNWGDEKVRQDTFFECVPMLTFQSETDGKEMALSETMVINEFLAARFGLLGATSYERLMILMIHSSTIFVQERFATTCTWADSRTAEGKIVADKAKQYFKTCALPTFLRVHTKHLVQNGSKGFYVGNQLSLADIRTTNFLEHLENAPEGKEYVEIIQRLGPEVWKVKEMVGKNEKIAAWKASKRCVELTEQNTRYLLDAWKYAGL